MIIWKTWTTEETSEEGFIILKPTATNFSAKSGNVRMASWLSDGKYTVYGVVGNEVLIGLNGAYIGWVNKSDIGGFAITKRTEYKLLLLFGFIPLFISIHKVKL